MWQRGVLGSAVGWAEEMARSYQALRQGAPWGFPTPLPPTCKVTFLLVSPGCRTKGARTITFAEFQQAMKELCGKRFKGKSPEEALQAVYGLIEGKEPGSAGTTVSRSFLAHSATGATMGSHIPRAILACILAYL